MTLIVFLTSVVLYALAGFVFAVFATLPKLRPSNRTQHIIYLIVVGVLFTTATVLNATVLFLS